MKSSLEADMRCNRRKWMVRNPVQSERNSGMIPNGAGHQNGKQPPQEREIAYQLVACL